MPLSKTEMQELEKHLTNKLIGEAKERIDSAITATFYGERQARLLWHALGRVVEQVDIGSDAKRDAISFYTAAEELVAAFTKVSADVVAANSALEGLKTRVVFVQTDEMFH
jgi:hypothetical protein